MIACGIGLVILLIGLIGFVVSLISCIVRRDWGCAPFVWAIVINIGNMTIQVASLFIIQ